ncbi:MAG TPA: hypothetical protein VJ600_09300 [Holophagaceae bacterium]|nr:hypothetical protein [Holophagaceae bacterium]
MTAFVALSQSWLGAGAPRQGVVCTLRAGGMVDAQAEQPGPGGRSRLLLSYTYDKGTLELVAADPESGRATVYPDPGTGEQGAKGLVVLSNGTAYLGTFPTGHILKLGKSASQLQDLGRPCPRDRELWVWGMALAADGKIYAATSPSTKLVRIDPATDRMEDLGTMDPSNTVGHGVEATPDGMVYMPTGYVHPQIVAYNTANGDHRLILPDMPSTSSAPVLFRDAEGHLIARSGTRAFRLSGYTATALPSVPPPGPGALSTKADMLGRLRLRGLKQARSKEVQDAGDWQPGPAINYAGKERTIFRFTAGNDGQIYCGTAYPNHYFKIDPRTGSSSLLGLIGPGEIYEMAPRGSDILLAAYAAFGGFHLLVHHTGAPVAFDYDPGTNAWITPRTALNPSGALAPDTAQNWRPKAMLVGQDGMAYIGAVPGYGQIGGAIYRWDPSKPQAQRFALSPELSVVSLCATRGWIVAGMSTEAGTGGKSPAKEAKLILWRPSDQQVAYSVVPVPGANQINSLAATPDGTVYGVAGTSEFFSFNVDSRKVERLGRLPVNCVGPNLNLFSCAGLGPDGNVYGLAKEGVWRIDTRSGRLDLYAPASSPITAGFAILGDRIYYASGPTLGWAELPRR